MNVIVLRTRCATACCCIRCGIFLPGR